MLNQSFETIFIVIELPYLIVGFSSVGKDCFTVTDGRDFKKRVDLCIMPDTLRISESIESVRDKWMKDIQSFKQFCNGMKISVNDGSMDLIYKNLGEEEEFRKNMHIKEAKYNTLETKLEEQLHQQGSQTVNVGLNK